MNTTHLSRLALVTFVSALTVSIGLHAQAPDRVADNLRVTVVAITASSQHENVDRKLADIAKAVQRHDANLKGFRIADTKSVQLAVGQKENVKLLDAQEGASADITILQKEDEAKRVRLAVKAPLVGEITYSTCYDKFFPILTRLVTNKDRERLIVAIMVRPAAKDGNVAKDTK